MSPVWNEDLLYRQHDRAALDQHQAQREMIRLLMEEAAARHLEERRRNWESQKLVQEAENEWLDRYRSREVIRALWPPKPPPPVATLGKWLGLALLNLVCLLAALILLYILYLFIAPFLAGFF